ncbi:hypothetical protein HMI54_005250 [Coelomomyces lativittatus]|nr:hypothetical protein HMI54_005250 [Coelomomyces lativittatus]
MWTITLSCNYALQCFGSLMVTPLIKRFSIQNVLALSILILGVSVGLVPILEVSLNGSASKSILENQGAPILFLIILFVFLGISQGVIELIRRVVPQDIVGSDAIKLKKMDSTVHIFYEIAGTTGAMVSFFALDSFNPAYALTIIPFCFGLSAYLWSRIRLNNPVNQTISKKFMSFSSEISGLFQSFSHSVVLGCRLVFTRRDLIWLIPAYSLPLVIHKYLENVLFIKYGKDGLGNKALSQILLAGSNFGELLGAVFILLFANLVETPLPWLRLDALTLLIVWIFPFVEPFENKVLWTGLLAVIMCCISFGWASGDVSLVAFVQSHLGTMDDEHNMASPLGAVMAFLYVMYIVLFAVLSPIAGYIYDTFLADFLKQNDFSPAKLVATQKALFWTGGVFFSVCAVIIFASTFIPKGSWALNPKMQQQSYQLDSISSSQDALSSAQEFDKKKDKNLDNDIDKFCFEC